MSQEINLLFPDIITSLTPEEAAINFYDSWKSAFNSEPSTAALSILWAQSALETGRWKKIHNYNFGNIKKTKDHDYCMFRCSEIIDGKNKFFDPPHPQTHFNSYSHALLGGISYLLFLQGRKRYALAWEALKEGNPEKYCNELKIAGYFTADLDSYTKGVVSLTKEFLKKEKDLFKNKKEIEISILKKDIDYGLLTKEIKELWKERIRLLEVDNERNNS